MWHTHPFSTKTRTPVFVWVHTNTKCNYMIQCLFNVAWTPSVQTFNLICHWAQNREHVRKNIHQFRVVCRKLSVWVLPLRCPVIKTRNFGQWLGYLHFKQHETSVHYWIGNVTKTKRETDELFVSILVIVNLWITQVRLSIQYVFGRNAKAYSTCFSSALELWMGMPNSQ